MHKITKACDIPPKVKEAVWERDKHLCIICGSPYAMPNAHFIPRSHGGLGIEENIFTACQECHDRYDKSIERKDIAAFIEKYMVKKYPCWNKEMLVYRKYEWEKPNES